MDLGSANRNAQIYGNSFPRLCNLGTHLPLTQFVSFCEHTVPSESPG